MIKWVNMKDKNEKEEVNNRFLIERVWIELDF